MSAVGLHAQHCTFILDTSPIGLQQVWQPLGCRVTTGQCVGHQQRAHFQRLLGLPARTPLPSCCLRSHRCEGPLDPSTNAGQARPVGCGHGLCIWPAHGAHLSAQQTQVPAGTDLLEAPMGGPPGNWKCLAPISTKTGNSRVSVSEAPVAPQIPQSKAGWLSLASQPVSPSPQAPRSLEPRGSCEGS